MSDGQCNKLVWTGNTATGTGGTRYGVCRETQVLTRDGRHTFLVWRAAPLRKPPVVGLNMTIDDRCPDCGALLALVGRTHRCEPLRNLRDMIAGPGKQDQRASGSQHVSIKSGLMPSPSHKSGWTAERRAKHSAFMHELQRKKQEAAAAAAAQQEAAAQQAQQVEQARSAQQEMQQDQ